MVKISVVIIAFNEEKNLPLCIDSARKVSDDVIVVDSYSTDGTKQICLERGVRFIENQFKSYSDQKNFGITLAKNDHILSLDADEYLSDELINSIREITKSWSNEALKMNRLSSYGGKWIRHGNWYPDRQIRLWHRKYGQWDGENLHEKVKLSEGVKVIQLKGDLLHRSYKNSNDAINKIQLYSDIYAASFVGNKYPSGIGILFKAAFAFLKSYLLKRGILDGFAGLAVAVSVANYTFYKYAKLYEANKKTIDNQNKIDLN